MTRGKLVTVVIVAALAIGGAVMWRGVLPLPPPPATSWPAELTTLYKAASELHAAGDWCSAAEKWQGLLKQTSAYQTAHPGAPLPSLESIVEQNLAIAKRRCSPGEGERLVSPGDEPLVIQEEPREIGETELQRHFPVGRRTRAVAYTDLVARGDNTAWIFRENANFWYESRAVSETNVLTGTVADLVRLEITLPEVQQSLMISDRRLQLKPVDSVVFAKIKAYLAPKAILALPPAAGAQVRTILQLQQIVDPNLKHSLSWLNIRLIDLGWRNPDAETQLVERIDSLAGTKVLIEYSPSLGKKTVSLSEGNLIPPEDLRSFASSLGLLQDFVLGKVLETKVGEEFSVPAADAFQMFGFRYDVEIEGALTFRRQADEKGLAKMAVVGGQIIVTSSIEGETRRATLTPKEGPKSFALYDPVSHAVTEAHGQWTGDLDFFTTNHLLFKTEAIRDGEATSHYFAEISSGPEEAP